MQTAIPIYAMNSLKSDNLSGILIERFEDYLRCNNHLMHAHKHHFFHLVFFTAGSGEQFIDFNKHPVKPGIIYFMSPGQVHHWKFDEQPEGFIINFSDTYFSSFLQDANYLNRFRFFNGAPLAQVIALPPALQAEIKTIFENLLSEFESGKVHEDYLKTLLLEVFFKVASYQKIIEPGKEEAYNHTLINNFQQLIEIHYKQYKLPKAYAKLLYITPNHLNAVCKDFLGVPAGTLIRNRTLLEAKRLLVNLDKRIGEIADELNYSDQSYFIKFFKKYEGLTPEKFRKQISHGSE